MMCSKSEKVAWRLWHSLSIAQQKHLLSQFSANVWEEIDYKQQEDWEGRPYFDEIVYYTAHRKDVGFLGDKYADEFEAMDNLFDSLLQDYSLGLFIKLVNCPTMTVCEPLLEIY